MIQYSLCNWQVHSDFELPELSLWQGGAQSADITIRRGTIAIEDMSSFNAHVHIALKQGSLFQVADVARYWVTGGNTILIEPCPTASPSAIRLFLLGTAFGLLCHQRGLIPLHASCVAIDGRAVAFAGPSGIGKSTLAAALARHGCSVMADDVCLIDCSLPGLPRVHPFAPRLKLAKDSLSAVGFSLDQAEVMDFESKKLDLIHSVNRHCKPLPLSAIYHLGIQTDKSNKGIKLEQGAAALALLNQNIYRIKMARQMGRQRVLFDAAAHIASRVTNYSLTRDFDFSDLEDFIQCLLLRRAA